jgi:hypothetical protein
MDSSIPKLRPCLGRGMLGAATHPASHRVASSIRCPFGGPVRRPFGGLGMVLPLAKHVPSAYLFAHILYAQAHPQASPLLAQGRIGDGFPLG